MIPKQYMTYKDDEYNLSAKINVRLKKITTSLLQM